MILIHSLVVACLLLVSQVSAASTSSSTASKRAAVKQYCTPNQACWPSAADWSAFNNTISGRLIKVTPWQDPCYASPNGYKQPQCQSVRLNYFDGKTRASYPGATQTDNWSYCSTNKGLVGDCSLTASTTGQLDLSPVTDHECKLGRLSPYAVAIATNEDVTAALAFAKAKNIKVVIKNTGHEYLGRGTAPDSLMLWTHNLQSISYSPSFAGTGKTALVLGAGVNADDAYGAAAQNGRTITLGAYASVGVAGGFAMGGGHGPLGPTYGLAVDNVLQYTVVTADGVVRTANAQSEPKLYWALRGGGGGTWGVVTETVYEVHPPTSVVSVVYNITLNPLLSATAKQAAVTDLISKMAQYQTGWTKKRWAGYVFITLDQITFAQFNPTSDLLGATADMKDFVTYLTTNKNWLAVPISAFVLTPNFEVWRKVFFGIGASNTPVAYAERLASRLIPYTAFVTTAQQQQLAKDVVSALTTNANNAQIGSDVQYRPGDSLQIYSTGPQPAAWGGPSGANTGVNTAWRSSLWEVVTNSAWTNKMSQANRNLLAKQTSQAGDFLRKYGTGTYFSESDVLEKNWQTAFFGDNYKQLVAVKKQYDVNNTFVVYKGIGYEGQEGQAAFACYQQA